MLGLLLAGGGGLLGSVSLQHVAPTTGPVGLLGMRRASSEHTPPCPRKAFKADALDFLENKVTEL